MSTNLLLTGHGNKGVDSKKDVGVWSFVCRDVINMFNMTSEFEKMSSSLEGSMMDKMTEYAIYFAGLICLIVLLLKF